MPGRRRSTTWCRPGRALGSSHRHGLQERPDRGHGHHPGGGGGAGVVCRERRRKGRGGGKRRPGAGVGSPNLQHISRRAGAAAGSCVTAPIDLAASTDPIYLELYGTGIRGYKTGIAATIGGLAIPNPAFGVQSQYPGMDQVNLLLDRSLIGRGEVDVVLTVDGVAANTVKINVR